MGWYIKKSFKVGPVRLNLSKSGIGASLGVKGLRVSTGPKGRQFNAGREGLYYRKSLNSLGEKPSAESKSGDAAVTPSEERANPAGQQLGSQFFRGIFRGLFRGR